MKKPRRALPEPAWAGLYSRMLDGHAAAEAAFLSSAVRVHPSLSAAARELGVSRYALTRSMVRLGIILKASRPSDPAATVTA